MGDVRPPEHAEGAAQLDDLRGHDDRQWEQPSLCGGWDRARGGRTTRLGAVLDLARAGFDVDRHDGQGSGCRRAGRGPSGGS